MPDICVLLRNGVELEDNLRRILFSMAQYMIDAELESLSFDGGQRPFTASMRTEFKVGCKDSQKGTIFNAHIKYEDGREAEAIFLAEYLKNWRDIMTGEVELVPIYDVGGDPDENWKN
jgi:hypothetical protein